jgi:hypothetical protein
MLGESDRAVASSVRALCTSWLESHLCMSCVDCWLIVVGMINMEWSMRIEHNQASGLPNFIGMLCGLAKCLCN